MSKRRIFDTEAHAQFITFSCYRRRRLLDHGRLRDAFVGITAEKLEERRGICCGFVVMPNHVHAIVWFDVPGTLSPFMKSWKQVTSIRLKKVLRGVAPKYARSIPREEPFWQAKYYPFNLFTAAKAREKLDYMHLNPVRAGLVERAGDWRWSSARFYDRGEVVGIPLRWVFDE